MWLTDVSIRRPIFIVMFVLALVVLGWQSRSRMPAELTPNIELPYVTVVTVYPGAGPNEVETTVTEPIEKAVMSIGGVRNVTSSSQEGLSTVLIEFELGTDADAAAADVRDKVGSVQGSLPEDAEDPKVMKLDVGSQPIMLIGMYGSMSPREMRILADDVITDRLAKVRGVGAVNVIGGEEREINVAVDKDRLQAYGIPITAVVQAIKAANLNIPAGSIKEGARDYSVRTVGEFQTAEEIANLRLYIPGKGGAPGTTIRLGDIATVRDTVAEPKQISRLNGKPSVTISVQKQTGANTVEVAKGVKRELKALKSILPRGVKLVVARDDSQFVEYSLHDVNKSLTEGILLVVAIVFLFLHTVRATFIVAIAIPTSIMATYIPISAFGFTLNNMTLLALSLVVGILVDDSIVVLENIERHLRMRKHPRQAALDGRSEIGLAAITITFVDIVVFVPIAFMGGIVGQFFRQFGITVATATAFSLLMSFTLTPMLASRWMKSADEEERDQQALRERLENGTATLKDKVDAFIGRVFGAVERFLRALDRRYRGVLQWALHNRFLTVVIGFVSLLVVVAMTMPLPGAGAGPAAAKMMMPRVIVALLALALSAAAMKIDARSKGIALGFGIVMAIIALTVYLPFGFSMFPEVDRGVFQISVRTPPGTSLKATDEVVRKIERVLEHVPELKGGFYSSVVGASSTSIFGGDSGSEYATIEAQCVDKSLRKRSIQEIADSVAAQMASIPGAALISTSVSSGMGGGARQGIQKEVQGQRMSDIIEEANRVAAVMRRLPGAVDVDISYKESKPERRIIVDKLRAAQFNLTVAQVAAAVRTAIDGNDSAKLREEGTEYPIRVQFARPYRDKASDIKDIIVGSVDGSPIYLKDVADVRYDLAPTKIDRKNRQRVVYVTANIASGAHMGNVSRQVDSALKKIEHVPGTTIGTGGFEQIMYESFGYMFSALFLAIALVYMLMGALFESFLTPFVIMFSLPQAMVGALLALLITGRSLSIVAMIGIIMLMGLVTKNAILLVDYTNTLRSRGKSRDEAILEAGPTRLRPILMTTLAMIGGMLPTALALSRGAEMRSPMAIAVIGGLALSTLLTLIVIPVMYTIIDDLWQGFARRFYPPARARKAEPELAPVSGEAFASGSEKEG
ncbi:MAG: efflux RND transporter permease subunit [Armatimonadota bacterium]|nr:efflux RND transporter permease subunit [Armatimonadota bacterium]